jgi:hypothetical protein
MRVLNIKILIKKLIKFIKKLSFLVKTKYMYNELKSDLN